MQAGDLQPALVDDQIVAANVYTDAVSWIDESDESDESDEVSLVPAQYE